MQRNRFQFRPAALIERWSHLVTTQPAPVCIVLLCLAAAAGSGLQHLGFDFSPQALFDTQSDEREVHDAFTDTFGHADNVLLVLYEADDVLAPEALAAVFDAAQRLERVSAVERVESVATSAIPRLVNGALHVEPLMDEGDTVFEEVALALLSSNLARNRLLSEDRGLTVLALHLEEAYLAVELLSPLIEDIEGMLPAAPDGARWSVAGIPHVRAQVVDRLKVEQLIFIPITAVIYIIVLIFIFRSLAGVVLPIITVLGSVGITLGMMGWTGEPLNIINNTVPTLIFVIGISDSIHVLSRYEEERRALGGNLAAIRRTVRAMAVACFLTSFTSAVGFASLLVSQTAILQRFGVVAAVGVLVAYAVTLSLIPSMLVRFGYERRGPTKSDKVLARSSAELTGLEAVMDRITLGVTARPYVVMALGVLFTLLCLHGASRVVVDSAMLEVFAPDDEVALQTRMLEERLDGVLPMEVAFRSDEHGRFNEPDILNAMLRIAEAANEEPIVRGTWSGAHTLLELLRIWTDSPERSELASRAQVVQLASLLQSVEDDPLSPWFTYDGDQARLQVRVADDGGRATLQFSERLADVVERELEPLDDVQWYFTGDAYVGAIGMHAFIRDLLSSLSMAVLIIFAFMSLTFRSIRLGLLSIPANLLPLLTTLAMMGWLGIELNTTTVILFSISLGLAVDDTIHVLARYAEAVHAGLGARDAVRASIRGAGRAILLTSVLLVAGLLVLSTSAFVPTQRFALLTSVTIVGCFIADILLLPPLLLRFGIARKDT